MSENVLRQRHFHNKTFFGAIISRLRHSLFCEVENVFDVKEALDIAKLVDAKACVDVKHPLTAVTAINNR